MRRLVWLALSVLALAVVSCEEKKVSACLEECPAGWACNESTGLCEEVSGDVDTVTDTDTDKDADTDKVPPDGNDTDDGGEVDDTLTDDDDTFIPDIDMDIDTDGMACVPMTQETCPYTGPENTEGVGTCKAGKRICKEDGSGWTACSGQVTPLYDTCGDEIDQDCNGTADDLDQDKDGVTECGGVDCCYTTEGEEGCPDPKNVYPGAPEIPNGLDDNCNDEIDEGLYDCDGSVLDTSTDPMDFAKVIGLCATTTEQDTGWGVISAEFLLPIGTGTPHAQSHGIFPSFGTVLTPKAGDRMAMLTTGFAANPFDSDKFGGKQMVAQSSAPADWLTLNGNVFPAAPVCGGAGTAGSVNDPVMFKLRVRVPDAAKSFSVNVYFFSQEYVKYVCSDYNDFFLTLLDSTYVAPVENPELANPTDKNLAMDGDGNPVGVNLAPVGLFKQCVNGTSDAGTVITTCVDTNELAGTGFSSYGGTGWLTTRGNVKGGEVIELRFVIWDTGPSGSPDYIYNSAVLIDNFQWQYEEYEPGTIES